MCVSLLSGTEAYERLGVLTSVTPWFTSSRCTVPVCYGNLFTKNSPLHAPPPSLIVLGCGLWSVLSLTDSLPWVFCLLCVVNFYLVPLFPLNSFSFSFAWFAKICRTGFRWALLLELKLTELVATRSAFRRGYADEFWKKRAMSFYCCRRLSLA